MFLCLIPGIKSKCRDVTNQIFLPWGDVARAQLNQVLIGELFVMQNTCLINLESLDALATKHSESATSASKYAFGMNTFYGTNAWPACP